MSRLLCVAITGAAGNLGGLLVRELIKKNMNLHLLIHTKDISGDLKKHPNVSVFRTDLNKPETLTEALKNVDIVVHFAGILFKSNPQKFLPITNTVYFNNLLEIAIKEKIRRIILISFPHVEGESTPENPARGSLNGNPQSIHAQTRLEEEKLLFQAGEKYGFEAVSLRASMVYGKGILMIDVAQRLAHYGLLGVWKKPTWIHLISKVDFVSATCAAIEKPGIGGIYHIGDDGIQTLQQFLDDITAYRGNHTPWRMPVWVIMTAARGFELFSALFNVKSLLTTDFIRIGKVSYYGDTARMKQDLLPVLKYKTYKEGMDLF